MKNSVRRTKTCDWDAGALGNWRLRVTLCLCDKEEILSVQGIFVEIGLIPNSDFAEDIEKNQLGEIKINHYNETSIPAIFAAGDVTDVPDKQIIIAAGEGAKAVLSAFRYLAKHKA